MNVINKWMIYGANGYTGRLIAEEAVRRGQQPVIAGRNEAQLAPIADELDLSYRCFGLDSPQRCRESLADIGLVVNCAGPFSQTAEPMRQACLAVGCHYLDITGEMAVLSSSYALHQQARQKGIVVISGVGFDVVPTDMLAAKLKNLMPSATHLELAFAGDGGISPGTAKTMVEMLPEKGKIRRQGEIVTVPLAYECKEIPFQDSCRNCMTIPWGDIATAYFSTEIANIQVLTAVPPNQAKWMRRINPLTGLLGIGFVQNWLKKQITKHVTGPSKQVRDTSKMQLWGQVSDGKQQQELTMETPEGYQLTVKTALLFVEELLAHKILPGAYTPSQAIEPKAFWDLEGVVLYDH